MSGEAKREREPRRDPKPTEPLASEEVAPPPPDAGALGARVQHARCAYCHEEVRPGPGGLTGCTACLAWSHEACWRDHGSCAACGATSRSEAPAASAAPARRSLLPASFGLVALPWVFAGFAAAAPHVGSGLFLVGVLVWVLCPLAAAGLAWRALARSPARRQGYRTLAAGAMVLAAVTLSTLLAAFAGLL